MSKTSRTSPWLIAARVLFTMALAACIVFIFSNSMQMGAVSEGASGRVLRLVQRALTRLGMPELAAHVTQHFIRKLAHFCEYTLEGFLLMLCLRVYTTFRWLCSPLPGLPIFCVLARMSPVLP